MAKSHGILGLNARSQEYLKPFNRGRGRRVADSKLLTKKYLKRAGLPVPQMVKVFRTAEEVVNFAWAGLPESFVLKPVSGYAGEGIIIVKKRAKYAGEWRQMDDAIVTVGDLKLRAIDILAGQYSLHNLPDAVMIEERIKISKVFRKYAFQGTPDIRVIVFNKVPVMAMLRLPTAQSRGRANLHQGAIGVGVDVGTGVTTNAVYQGARFWQIFPELTSNYIKYLPGTKRKVNGLVIPRWKTILTLAVKAQEAIPDLGFMGVDIVFDKEHGPVILEVNARPGIEIQNANQAPLKQRLERVEGLKIRDAEHGVAVGRALFAAHFADKVGVEEGVQIINTVEPVRVRGADGKREEVAARIDTGAFRSSIDEGLAQKLGLLAKENILWNEGEKYAYRSAQGRESRKIIGLTMWLAGRRIKTSASVADRSKVEHQLLVGRNDLSGFLVRP